MEYKGQQLSSMKQTQTDEAGGGKNPKSNKQKKITAFQSCLQNVQQSYTVYSINCWSRISFPSQIQAWLC